MAAVTLNDIKRLPDIISSARFELLFGETPGNSDKNLHLKILDTSLTNVKNEAITVELFGHELKFRGKKTESHILPVTFLEDMNMATYNALKTWHKKVVDSSTGSGLRKTDYTVNADLYVYDHKNEKILSNRYHNVFIEELQEIQFSGESYEPIRISATFSYDYKTQPDISE